MDLLTLALAKKGGGASSWNDLADKPFGDVTPEPIVFDGNTEGKDSFLFEPGGDTEFILTKISDIPLTLDELNTATFTVKYLKKDGTAIEDTFVPDNKFAAVMELAQGFRVVLVSGGFRFMVFDDSGDIDVEGLVISAPSRGIYVVSFENNTMGSLADVTTTYAEITLPSEVKTLDEKYLPDSVKGGGGAFVLRPTEDELSGTFGEILCTTNFDEMAKALETGTPVYVVLPASFSSSGMGVKERILLLSWAYATDGGISGIMGRFMTFSNITNNAFGQIVFTNGTYVPTM